MPLLEFQQRTTDGDPPRLLLRSDDKAAPTADECNLDSCRSVFDLRCLSPALLLLLSGPFASGVDARKLWTKKTPPGERRNSLSISLMADRPVGWSVKHQIFESLVGGMYYEEMYVLPVSHLRCTLCVRRSRGTR